MRKLAGISLVLAMGLGLVGCASTSTSTHGTLLAARTTGGYAAGPVPQDPNPRGLAAAPRDVTRSLGDLDPHSGIPTPEPAVPHHDTQLAGPTPQIPIPVVGRPVD